MNRIDMTNTVITDVYITDMSVLQIKDSHTGVLTQVLQSVFQNEATYDFIGESDTEQTFYIDGQQVHPTNGATDIQFVSIEDGTPVTIH